MPTLSATLLCAAAAECDEDDDGFFSRQGHLSEPSACFWAEHRVHLRVKGLVYLEMMVGGGKNVEKGCLSPSARG